MKMRSVVPLLYLPLVLFTSTVVGAATEGGKIHFVGAIVEDSCDISTHPQKVVFDCPAKGAKRVRQSIALADIHAAQRHNTLPATLKLHYLDTGKKLAVLSVSYR